MTNFNIHSASLIPRLPCTSTTHDKINNLNFCKFLELPRDIDNRGVAVAKEILKFIEYFSLTAFYVEIVLKWIDSFKGFWRSGWNIVDFAVTVLVCHHAVDPSYMYMVPL